MKRSRRLSFFVLASSLVLIVASLHPRPSTAAEGATSAKPAATKTHSTTPTEPATQNPAAAPAPDRGFDYAGATAKTVDVLLLRPLGAARLLIGAALLVPTSVLIAVGAAMTQDGSYFALSANQLVVEPYEFLIERPLGEDLSGS